MKAFLEEYGLIIVAIAVILILLALGTEVGQTTTKNVLDTITGLFDKANSANGTPNVKTIFSIMGN